jgi:hypothetical protein
MCVLLLRLEVGTYVTNTSQNNSLVIEEVLKTIFFRNVTDGAYTLKVNAGSSINAIKHNISL